MLSTPDVYDDYHTHLQTDRQTVTDRQTDRHTPTYRQITLANSIHCYLRPMTDAPEVGTINSMPDSCASFSCQCMTSNATDCLPDWHRNLASNLGVWHRFLERVSGALCHFWSGDASENTPCIWTVLL